MGLQHSGVLVHRADWAEPAIPGLDLWGAAELFLDDRFLQPTGLPDSHETGTHSIRLPTYLPTAEEKTRWHTQGEAGTQPHSHTQTCIHVHAYTHFVKCRKTFPLISIYTVLIWGELIGTFNPTWSRSQVLSLLFGCIIFEKCQSK